MPDTREPSGRLLGLAAFGMAACCALPLLFAGGIARSAAGLALGSLIVIAVGAALAIWGWRRHTTRHRETPQPPQPVRRAGPSSVGHDPSQPASPHLPTEREPR